MPTCVQCRTEVGFIGSLGFSRQTGRCSKCEGETRQALSRFRAAFLSFCRDGILTKEKWSTLLAGAARGTLSGGGRAGEPGGLSHYPLWSPCSRHYPALHHI